MKRLKYFVLITVLLMELTASYAQQNLGLFDNHLDIGPVRHQGFATYEDEEQIYTIGGSGKNMWFGEDQFHYLWTTIQGDFILRAEVEFLGQGVDPHRKVGWVVKSDLDHDTPHINATTHGDGLTALQFRNSDGGETKEVVSTDTFPDVIQLERKGNTFIMSTARFGEPYKEVRTENAAIRNQAYVGLYMCSHNPDIVEVAKFRNVRIIQPADPDFTPYRDYIGSRLEIMNVATGHRRILHSTEHSIQAPNWTEDGNLIYNSEGRLFNYNLARGEITPINTGFATSNNNDHVLSFDGRFMGISHHNSDEGNTSTLYYLPLEGSSNPIRVTQPGVGASYLHGWSKDGKKMVFTGNRKDQYDIYSVNVESGIEKQLTNQKTLDDGSEFSPDGEQIYFNSARSGKMKIWKMDPNGNKQTQLTFDEYNDWFPHISPDQKWIVILSFPKDIDPGDHPFYKHCLLRIMPYEGGTPQVIGYIYGGQGSINVPSWSPDSKHIAFVTNTKM